MDSSVPYEYRELQLLAGRYIDSELRPLEKAMTGEWGGSVPRDIWNELLRKSKELGLFGAFVPEEFGGGGIRSWLAHILISEEIGKFQTSGHGS